MISNLFCTCKIIPQSWAKNIVKTSICPVIKAKNRGLVFGLKTIKIINCFQKCGLLNFYKINQNGTQNCVLFKIKNKSKIKPKCSKLIFF